LSRFPVFNFAGGPASLPRLALERLREEMFAYGAHPYGVFEINHRSRVFEELLEGTQQGIRDLMGLSDDFEVLFLQGGASQQFAMVPMNFLRAGDTADYVLTGGWAQKAFDQVRHFAGAHIAFSSKDTAYDRVPRQDELSFVPESKYVHITTNNTLYGTQWHSYPSTEGIPLVGDASSDILCRRMDYSNFALLYASAQKNLGPAGCTLVVIHRPFLDAARPDLPEIFSYKSHVEKKSILNTPPILQIYMISQTLEWIKASGGIAAVEKENLRKAAIVYQALDEHTDFYRLKAEKASRSIMNVTFDLPTPNLLQAFLTEATAMEMINLKGPRVQGGVRASLYNPVPYAACERLAAFIDNFAKRNRS
jgi:phosphoserine aminotransferase